jgi:hypothetical protein
MLLLLSALTLLSTEPELVMKPIDGAFAALESGDSAELMPHVYAEGRVTGVGSFAGGFTGMRSRSWTEYAARMKKGDGFKERITNPDIRIDGDIAMVWAPFTIERGGKIVACGMDHFDMIRENGAWKIMNISFSSRTKGCPGQ